jgi:hypothetical protein
MNDESKTGVITQEEAAASPQRGPRRRFGDHWLAL